MNYRARLQMQLLQLGGLPKGAAFDLAFEQYLMRLGRGTGKIGAAVNLAVTKAIQTGRTNSLSNGELIEFVRATAQKAYGAAVQDRRDVRMSKRLKRKDSRAQKKEARVASRLERRGVRSTKKAEANVEPGKRRGTDGRFAPAAS